MKGIVSPRNKINTLKVKNTQLRIPSKYLVSKTNALDLPKMVILKTSRLEDGRDLNTFSI